MSQLQQEFESLGIPEKKIAEIVQALTTDPLQALTKVSELNLPADKLQRLMGLAISNPDDLMNLARKYGVSSETIDSLKSQFTPPPSAPDQSE